MERSRNYRGFKVLPKFVGIVGKATGATGVIGPTVKGYPAASESLKQGVGGNTG
jgi:hypothetical protein